jgi:hypothetical protein
MDFLFNRMSVCERHRSILGDVARGFRAPGAEHG